jgi:hypothetical protein
MRLLLFLLPLLLIVSTLPHLTTAKPKPTPTLAATYPCLTVFPSTSEPWITKMLPNGTLDTSVSFLTSGCKAGSKTFSYECGDQDCCTSTEDYDGGTLKAKLPKVCTSEGRRGMFDMILILIFDTDIDI